MKQFIYNGSLAIGESITLDGEDFSYLCKVRRSEIGDTIVLRDKAGLWFNGRFTSIEKRKCSLEVFEYDSDTPSPSDNDEPQIHLCQSLPKAGKMDLIIRQAVEAGISDVHPVEAERSIAKASDGNKKVQRWQKIVREAVQQSGSIVLPEVHTPCGIQDVLNSLPEDTVLVALHQDRVSSSTLSDAAASLQGTEEKHIALFIGPEGGFSDSEVDLFKKAKAMLVTLPSNILRTETAGIFAIAGIRVLMEKNSESNSKR